MIALLRAHARVVVGEPRVALLALAFLAVPPFIQVFLRILDGPARIMTDGLLLVAVYAVAGHTRGRASTPSGPDPWALPMPMLPADPRARTLAVVLLAETQLLVASVAMELATNVVCAGLPATNPFHACVVPLGPAMLGLAIRALSWVPVFVAGARLGNSLTPRQLLVGVAVAGAACAVGVPSSLPLAIAWAIGGTVLASRLHPGSTVPEDGVRTARPGLVGLLTSIAIQTGTVALLAAGGGLGLLLVTGKHQALPDVLPMSTMLAAAMFPTIPSAAVGPRVVQPGSEALFRLPVDRVRTTLTMMAAAAVRALLVTGLAALARTALVGPYSPLASGLGAVVVTLTAAGVAGVAATGNLAALLAALLVTMLAAVSALHPVMGGVAAWTWSLGGLAVLVAVPLLSLAWSSGRFGGTGRVLG